VRRVRHFLAIAPDRAGRPLHRQGATWFGLVEGRKTWYMYPPGTQVNYGDSTLRGAYDWALHLKSERVGEPFVCVQQRGEVLLLPKDWVHVSVSSGITAGIGGEHLGDVHEVDVHPTNDFFALLSAGQALEESAYVDTMTARKKHKATKTGVAKLSSDVGQFLKDISESEDIWIVNFYTLHNCSKCRDLSKSWQEVGLQTLGIASTGVVEVGAGKSGEILDSWKRFGVLSVPTLVIFQGGQRELRQHSHFLEEDSVESFNGKFLTADTEDEIMNVTLTTLEALKAAGGYRGSVSERTSKSRRLRHLALNFLQQADALQPNHPEVVILTARILGLGLKDVVAAKSVVRAYADYVTSQEATGGHAIPVRTTAVIYHALGQLLASMQSHQEAVEMFKRATGVDETYYSSFLDLIRIYSSDTKKDPEAAEEVWASLREMNTTQHYPRLAQ